MSKNNIDICDIAPSIEDILKENQWLKIEIKELKILNEHLNKYIDNFRQNSNIQYLHDNQQIYKMKKAIKILEDKIEFEDLGEMQSGNVYRGYFNDCLDEEDYELLKEVFERVGEE